MTVALRSGGLSPLRRAAAHADALGYLPLEGECDPAEAPALFLAALQKSFLLQEGDTLYVGFGFDEDGPVDAEYELPLAGGGRVRATVSGGRFTELSLAVPTGRPARRQGALLPKGCREDGRGGRDRGYALSDRQGGGVPMITASTIAENSAIRTYIEMADASLAALGYTDHSFAHVGLVAERAGDLLAALGHPAREVELARIAGLLHDIGNIVNRVGHSQSGALLAFRLLEEMGMSPAETGAIVTAIGNHDEGDGEAVSDIAAALILADKSDVRRSRVRNTDPAAFDIHDRVNFSVISSDLSVDKEARRVVLSLTIDTALSPVLDYFEIFLERMLLCRRAARRLGLEFGLLINGSVLL